MWTMRELRHPRVIISAPLWLLTWQELNCAQVVATTAVSTVALRGVRDPAPAGERLQFPGGQWEISSLWLSFSWLT